MLAGECDYTLHVCQDLIERHWDVDLITTEQDGIPNLPGLKIHPIMRRWSWREMPRLLAQVRDGRPTTILLLYLGWLYEHHPMVNYLPWIVKKSAPHTQFVSLFFNTSGASWVKASLASRIIYQVARVSDGAGHAGFEFGGLLSNSDRIVVLSETHRSNLASACPASASKIEVVPSFPILRLPSGSSQALRAKGRKRLGLRPNEFTLAYFGYIYPDKGIDVLLLAFQQVLALGRPARLLFIGGTIDPRCSVPLDYGDRFREQAHSLGIDHAITWSGGYAWDSDEPSQLLYASDACALPFNVGLALNNSSAATAAWHGLPIISTRGTFLEEAFLPDVNVVVCPPRDANAMAKAILRVMDNPDFAERLRAGSLALSQEWMSSKKSLDGIARILCSTRDSVEQTSQEPAANLA